MADAAPPRLDPSTGTAPGYAPISWMAVASLAVALLYLILIVALGLFAATKKQDLIEPALLALPTFAVVLAFAARRQIVTSEGTRTGERYAAAAWWIAVLAGPGYLMYLFGVEIGIRADAQKEFVAFAEVVAQIDPANPKDPALYEAVLRTVPPGQRGQVKGPKDIAAIDKVFRDDLVKMKQLDLVRLVGRNKGQVEFTAFGMKEWQQVPNRLSCTLSCKMLTPEGEHNLMIPMQATVDNGARQWQVVTTGSGLVQGKALTRYGWAVEQFEASGQYFAVNFITTLSVPEQQPAAYIGYVQKGRTPKDGGIIVGTAPGRALLTGGAGFACPTPKGYREALTKLFTLTDGAAPTSADTARFLDCWDNNRIQGSGFTLRDTPDQNSVLRLTDAGAEMRFPIELRLAASAAGGAARGRLVLLAADPALTAELTKLREESKETYREPPAELLSRLPAWRVERLESDLRGLQPAPPPPPPGGGGGGGMPGM
ncbi:MAG: hypothetical protein ACRC7O_08510 [Fimbriiglobus sp.]